MAAWIAYVVAPAPVGGLIHGIPLGALDTCALVAILWLTARRRRLPGAVAVAAALAATLVLAAIVPADRGLRARYFSSDSAEPPFERSTEFRSRSFTRIDDRLDFAPRMREFPLAFFNDIARFNFGRPDEPDRERLSFAVFWEGLWWRGDGSARTLFLDAPGASAQLTVDAAPVLSVAAGGGAATAVVAPARGWHRLEVRYFSPYNGPRRFAAGESIDGRRVPFSADTIVTRPMERWQMSLAAVLRIARTLFDVCVLVWLTLLVSRDLRDLVVRRHADGTQMTPLQQTRAWFAVIVIVDALIFAAPWLARLGILAAGDDPLTYESYARTIQLDGPLMRSLEGPYYYQVFYPYFLAATHAVFGEGAFGFVFVQRLLVALAVWMVVDIAVQLAGDRVWPVAFGCAAFVLYVKFAPLVASPSTESLFVPLLLAWTAALIRVCGRPTAWRVAGAGLLGGFAAVTRSTAVLAWMGVLPACWLAWKNSPRRGRLVTILALCSFGVVALIGVRNWVVAHELALLPTELPITLIGGNQPPPGFTPDYSRRGPLYDRFGVNPLTRQVIEYALTDPASFARNLGRKCLFAVGVYEPYAPGWGYSFVFMALTLTSIAGLMLALAARIRPPIVVAIPALIALSQFAAVVVVYPKGERLILPYLSVLLAYSSIAVSRALARRPALTPIPAAIAGASARRGVLPGAGGIAIVTALAIYTLVIRTRGITEHFLMLGEQIRDWTIALGPLSGLPLVGTPSTAGGNTLGPVYYWVLWLIRVILGPFVHNLPHTGGIGLSAVQSIADAVLCIGLRKASGSWLFAIAVVLILASSPFDLALSSVIWNPVLSVAFAKIAAGLVLYWGDALTRLRRMVLCAVAWFAVQAHSGALPFACAVFGWVFWTAWRHGYRRIASALVEAALVVLVLQLPSAFAPQSVKPTKLWAMALHPEALRPLDAFHAVADAVASIALAPFDVPHVPLLIIGAVVAVLVTVGLFTPLAVVTVVPLAVAVGMWSLWQGAVYDAYAFLTLVPPVVIAVLWLLRLPPDPSGRSVAAIALLVVAILIQKPRMDNATLVFRQPSYGALVRGSRAVLAHGEPVARIEAPFLPPTSDPEFVYTILGGTIRRDAPVVARLSETGEVTYVR